jgi:hypothetical protein
MKKTQNMNFFWKLTNEEISSDSDKGNDTDRDSDRGHDKHSAAASGTQVHIWSRPQDTHNSGGVHPLTGGPSVLRIQEVPHPNEVSTPITIFLFFMEVIQLLVVETNKAYTQ